MNVGYTWNTIRVHVEYTQGAASMRARFTRIQGFGQPYPGSGKAPSSGVSSGWELSSIYQYIFS